MNWIIVRANLVVMAGTFFWATGLPLMDHLLGQWDFMSLAAARSLIAGVFLFVLSYSMTRTLPRIQLVMLAILIGLITNGVGAACLVVGLSHSDPVTASILITLIPVISAIMDLFRGKRRIGWKLMLALVFSVTGGLLASLKPDQLRFEFGFGELGVLASAFFFVLYSRTILHYFSDTPQLSLLSIATLSGGASLLAFALVSSILGVELRYTSEPIYLMQLLFLGIFSMGISTCLWFYGAGRLGVTHAALHQNLVPAFVMLIMLLLGQGFDWMKALGGIFVVSGAVIAQTGHLVSSNKKNQ